MHYENPNPEKVRDRAEDFLEAVPRDKPDYLSDSEEHRLNGLLYLTARYGFRLSEELEEESADRELGAAARQYLNPGRSSAGTSLSGP